MRTRRAGPAQANAADAIITAPAAAIVSASDAAVS